MNIKYKIIIFLFVISFLIFYIRLNLSYEREHNFYNKNDYSFSLKENIPDCLKTFYAIEKFSKKYNIPIKYAFNIAYMETKYCGPSSWDYNARQESHVGAVGPMQIMPTTASIIWNKQISKNKLKNDINFNVETSMKLLKILYEKYKNWKIVFGCYNTGRPIINNYAKKVYNLENINLNECNL